MIPQFNGLSKILLGIYGSLIATLIVFNFIGADLYLSWEVTSILKKEAFNYLTFDKGLYNFNVPSKAYFINEFFQGGNIEAPLATAPNDFSSIVVKPPFLFPGDGFPSNVDPFISVYFFHQEI